MRSTWTIIAMCLSVVLALPARGDDTSTDRAIASGLAFLAQQQITDGSFQPRGQKLATTGLSLLAFLSTGNTADGGRYAGTVRRATEHLLRQTPGDRYFGRIDGSGTYGQAVVTLALSQAYGVEPDEPTRNRIRATVKDAVAILIAAQNVKKTPAEDGGWSNEITGVNTDPAISRWCLLTLHAAQRIGINVPKDNLDRATAFIARNTKERAAKPSTQPARFAADLRYFNARSETVKDAVAPLLKSQLDDGGWSTDGLSDSADRVYTTDLALLTLSLTLQLDINR